MLSPIGCKAYIKKPAHSIKLMQDNPEMITIA